jgi:hypothetical protein
MKHDSGSNIVHGHWWPPANTTTNASNIRWSLGATIRQRKVFTSFWWQLCFDPLTVSQCGVKPPDQGCDNVLPAQDFSFYFFIMGWDWVHLVLRPLFGLLYQPQMIDDGECGAVGGMRIGRGHRSTRRKPPPVPLCPPQIPHDLTWARTPAAAMGSRRLTTWAMARRPVRAIAQRWCSGD